MVHFNKVSSKAAKILDQPFLQKIFFVNLEIGTSWITVRVHTTPHLNYQNILKSIYLMKYPNCMKLLRHYIASNKFGDFVIFL
jgi:hypothetical protein